MDSSRGRFYYFNRDMGYTTWDIDEVMHIHHDNQVGVRELQMMPNSHVLLILFRLQGLAGRQLRLQMGGHISIMLQPARQHGLLLKLRHNTLPYL